MEEQQSIEKIVRWLENKVESTKFQPRNSEVYQYHLELKEILSKINFELNSTGTVSVETLQKVYALF